MKKATAEYIATMLRNEAEVIKDRLKDCSRYRNSDEQLIYLMKSWCEAQLRLADFEEWVRENEDILDESED